MRVNHPSQSLGVGALVGVLVGGDHGGVGGVGAGAGVGAGVGGYKGKSDLFKNRFPPPCFCQILQRNEKIDDIL